MNSLNYMLKKHTLISGKLGGGEITWLSSALIPAAPAKKIFGERMPVVGDAAGMVDPINGSGIMQAVNRGKLAGEVCARALEEENFSSKFLSQYQYLWHKTKYYMCNIYFLIFFFSSQNLIERVSKNGCLRRHQEYI